MKTTIKQIVACMLIMIMLFSFIGCGSSCDSSAASALDPRSPVTVTVWNYYNGDQLAAFDKLVEDFNASVGAQKGVVVLSVSQGDIATLANELLDSVDGKAGTQDLLRLPPYIQKPVISSIKNPRLLPLTSILPMRSCPAHVTALSTRVALALMTRSCFSLSVSPPRSSQSMRQTGRPLRMPQAFPMTV